MYLEEYHGKRTNFSNYKEVVHDILQNEDGVFAQEGENKVLERLRILTKPLKLGPL